MSDDLELGLSWFLAEYQLVEMRISTVKSEVMVLSKTKVECSLWVGRNDLLLPVKFKHLWDFFTSEGKVKRKAATQYWSVVVDPDLFHQINARQCLFKITN